MMMNAVGPENHCYSNHRFQDFKTTKSTTSNIMNKKQRKVHHSLGLILISILLSGSCDRPVRGQPASTFPGVSKELGSFCAARPSLPIDLASMIVHVKRNVSFNYKLYLFSSDHVFQTGQVRPRDDFRVHSFPVRAKRFQEFWPPNLAAASAGPQLDLKEFFRLVPLDEPAAGVGRRRLARPPPDATGDPLPGELPPEPFISHDVAHVMAERRQRKRYTGSSNNKKSETNLNKFIEFDRDDQVSPATILRSPESHTTTDGVRSHPEPPLPSASSAKSRPFERLVLPVGSFSSFHVNLTYLVRKDFDQAEPQLLKVLVDANKFQVSHWEVIQRGGATNNDSRTTTMKGGNEDDFAFLSHKLLRDVNTRITSINQIYEDWITRNFYTVVYVQRRLISGDRDDSLGLDDDDSEADADDGRDKDEAKRLINDRLIFRGSSMALLAADQLDYQVKAAAFITEKNGLHYYLEFLNTGKFYLCAVDWQKRPFKIIDWQQFPIKATRTQFDNEELLLCPPSVCYSDRPVDEIVSYGRLPLAEPIQRQISHLSLSLSSSSSANSMSRPQQASLLGQRQHVLQTNQEQQLNETAPISLLPSGVSYEAAARLKGRSVEQPAAARISEMDELVEAVRQSAAISQQREAARLHLRDWAWPLSRRAGDDSPFQWRYELAKRNDIKAKPDSYGYTLAGHEIDASYRVYNELYLISANQLIAINYTLANETAVSSIPVSDEFPGLTATLIDPITGAFYDRRTNRVYFFKGDRYIGFDYSTKKALEEFVLKPSHLSAALVPGADAGEQPDAGGGALLSSQPVVEILGRQHQVDAIYHDLASDLVYIFTGMKFYTFRANEFKDGAFRGGQLPQMHCINERFLDGCHFDKAYPNPCESGPRREKPASGDSAKLAQKQPDDNDGNDGSAVTILDSLKEFNQEQQLKLRSIASKAGLLNVLVENSLIGKGIRALEPASSSSSGRDQERLLIYLLMAIVVVTILITVVMILLMISSTSANRSKNSRIVQQAHLDQLNSAAQLARFGGAEKTIVSSHPLKRTSNHYLSNQNQSSRLRPYQVQASIPTVHHHLHHRPARTAVGVTISKKGHLHRDDIDNSVL